MSYDNAGNVTANTYSGSAVTRIYDAENKMKQAWANNQWQTYHYDGDGRRVKRIVNGTETWQVYGIGGELLAEYAANTAASSPQKEYGYRNGELLITATVTTGSGGSAFSFADDPLVVGTTSVKAAHLNELRTAINQARVRAGLSVASWSETITAGVTTIKASHVTELRTRLDEARTALGLSTGGYTDPALANGYDIRAAHISELRTKTNEALTSGGRGNLDIRWLVTDHLGTPRMIFDQTGSLAGVSRHDYLPFGEELFAGTGGRTTAQGYSASDNVRQKFTSYERDEESNLDYAQARYYSSSQGRFTSVDPISGTVTRPQSWNAYSYVRNTPLRLFDPYGMTAQDPQNRLLQVQGLPISNPCIVGTTGCNPVLVGEVTSTASASPIPTTDVQIVTELQIRTGVANPLGTQGYTATLLDAMFSGNGGIAVGSVAVGTAQAGPPGAIVGGAVVGSLIAGALALDVGRSIADAIDDAIPTTPPPDPGLALYRGVPVDSPAFPAALIGTAIPIGGHSNPTLHNAGNTRSIFTSWSFSPATAARFAGSGGVVLFKNIERTRAVPSPDIFYEQEVLVIGPVTGAQVRRIP